MKLKGKPKKKICSWRFSLRTALNNRKLRTSPNITSWEADRIFQMSANATLMVIAACSASLARWKVPTRTNTTWIRTTLSLMNQTKAKSKKYSKIRQPSLVKMKSLTSLWHLLALPASKGTFSRLARWKSLEHNWKELLNIAKYRQECLKKWVECIWRSLEKMLHSFKSTQMAIKESKTRSLFISPTNKSSKRLWEMEELSISLKCYRLMQCS